MKIRFVKILTAASSIFMFGAAQAETFSFDAITGLGELTPNSVPRNCGPVSGIDQDYCYGSLEFTVGTLTATVSATTDYTGASADDLIAWYDISPANRGGIGATNDVTDTSTDNAAPGEFIRVTFSSNTSLAGAWFNGNHVDVSGLYGVVVDVATGLVYATQIIGSYADFSAAGLFGSDFIFWVTSSIDSLSSALSSAESFYLAGIEVPEPATLALLSLGLLGAGVARRKRKT